MLARVVVLCRMFVLRRITTAHVAAGETQPKMHPAISHLQALLLAPELSVLLGCIGLAGLSIALLRLHSDMHPEHVCMS